MRPLAAALIAAIALAIVPAVCAAATGAEVAARLSAQRAAHGIPGGLTENPDWSAKCAKHVAWIAQNGRLQHGEEPGTPGYSEDGDWAGRNSNLARFSGLDFNRGNPYLHAPYHLLALMHPAMESIGAFENGEIGCHTTFPGFTRPAPASDTFYSYPGNGTTIPWSEKAHESPSVPGDAVGLPDGTITGPNIEVFWRGPGGGQDEPPTLDNLVSATLRDAGGNPVEVRTVGRTQSDLVINGTGFVIPAAPLQPGSSYSASATFSAPDGSRAFTGQWSFNTTSLPSPKKAVKIKLTNSRTLGLLITLTGADVYAARVASVTVDYGKGDSKLKAKIPLGNTLRASPVKKRKTVTVTVSVKAFSVGGVKVPAAKAVKRLKAK
jgi:hypothetical protein